LRFIQASTRKAAVDAASQVIVVLDAEHGDRGARRSVIVADQTGG
jgi:hypothetical protein